MESDILKFFKDKEGIVSIDLFGSYAEQRAGPESDIDIAILCEWGKIPTPLELIEWRSELESLLHKNIDLVCLNDVSPILGMQIAKNRKNLLMNKSRPYDDYQMRLFSDYAELKELRRPMEENILKRKFFS